MIGIHTPEFDFEKSRERVAASIRDHGLKFPVMMDNDYAYWKKLGNRYWPTFYLADKEGNLAGSFYGETHPNTERAQKAEAVIEKLLAAQ